jgi:hypothetical protein
MEEDQLLRQADDLHFLLQHSWSLPVRHELIYWELVGVEMPNRQLVEEVRELQLSRSHP